MNPVGELWSARLFIASSDDQGVRYAATMAQGAEEMVVAGVDAVRGALDGSPLRVPEVESADRQAGQVTLTFALLPGLALSEPGHQAEQVVGALGRSLATLHQLDPPSELETLTVAALAELATRRGSERNTALEPPYERHSPQRLVEIMAEGQPDEAPELAVSHGYFGVGALVVAGSEVVGLAPPLAAVLADRHLDLSALVRDAAGRLPREVVPRLLEAYDAGRDGSRPVEPLRLDWFDLARSLAQPGELTKESEPHG